MTSEQVRAMVEAEIAGDWSRSNDHNVDLKKCLVTPRLVSCRNTFPRLNRGRPLDMWLVLEEFPGSRDGYLIVFDERKQQFGIADWNGDVPVFLGYHGTFLDALAGM